MSELLWPTIVCRFRLGALETLTRRVNEDGSEAGPAKLALCVFWDRLHAERVMRAVGATADDGWQAREVRDPEQLKAVVEVSRWPYVYVESAPWREDDLPGRVFVPKVFIAMLKKSAP